MNLKRMPLGEDSFLEFTDAEMRRHGERLGFDTLLVHAANVEY